ncbi:MAG: chorismate synthase, partial [bacterium]
MLGNSFGRVFRVYACGESYGEALQIIVDGVPAGIPLSNEGIQKELDRRRPGQSKIDSPRGETDKVQIVAGLMEGITTGAPVGMIIYNVDRQQIHVDQYREAKDLMRPGHGEHTFYYKYGQYADWCGAGRGSGRETACRVAAGALAKKILDGEGIQIAGYVSALHGIEAGEVTFEEIVEHGEENIIRCPDAEAAEKMIARCLEIKDEGDTCGGIVEIRVRGVPPGLGEPVFDKLSATLAHAIMSIGAVKGFEIGAGFETAKMKGSECNDLPYVENGQLKFK